MITQAEKQDALRCIQLLNLAMEDIAFALSGVQDRAGSDEILAKFFTQEINRLSYQNVYVFKSGGVIAGAICAYYGGDIKALDEPILTHLKSIDDNAKVDKECLEDEFYIDSIAVDEKFRGQGIASNLIKFAFDLAGQRGYKKVALLVDKDKVKERKFYEKLGFRQDFLAVVNSHEYYHMIKEI